jgi:hypothetical protein
MFSPEKFNPVNAATPTPSPSVSPSDVTVNRVKKPKDSGRETLEDQENKAAHFYEGLISSHVPYQRGSEYHGYEVYRHCLGLITQSYRAAGLDIPKPNSAKDMLALAQKHGWLQTKGVPGRGDLVFYAGDPTFGHVGMGLGNGKVGSSGGGTFRAYDYNNMWGSGNKGEGQLLGFMDPNGMKVDPKDLNATTTSPNTDRVKNDAQVARSSERTDTQPLSITRPTTASLSSQFSGLASEFAGAVSNFFGGSPAPASSSPAAGAPQTATSVAPTASDNQPSSSGPISSSSPIEPTTLAQASSGSQSPLEQPVGKL